MKNPNTDSKNYHEKNRNPMSNHPQAIDSDALKLKKTAYIKFPSCLSPP